MENIQEGQGLTCSVEMGMSKNAIYNVVVLIVYREYTEHATNLTRPADTVVT